MAKKEDEMTNGWQLIETAPKDGTRILAWLPDDGMEAGGYEAIVSYVSFGGPPPDGTYAGEPYRDGWCNDWDGAYANPDPSLWMPLPANPVASGLSLSRPRREPR